MESILITGGAGFIGSALVRLLLKKTRAHLLVADKLTYAGKPSNLPESSRITLAVADVCSREKMAALFRRFRPKLVFHLAAESHVDRSIASGTAFARTNVLGTAVLLECARQSWKKEAGVFVQVSTDEVYGSLPLAGGAFTEHSPLAPRSPYAAAKAGADLLALSYHATHGMDVRVTRCSNNYGPRQHGEKFLPTVTAALFAGQPAPVYGDGQNVRDWIFVEDHCTALWAAAQKGAPGQVYNIGARNEKSNLAMVEAVRQTLVLLGEHPPAPGECVRLVQDRLGHDRRYAIDPSRAGRELGFCAQTPFEEGLKRTVAWEIKRLKGEREKQKPDAL